MLEQEFEWFFTTHSQTLRKGGKWGLEVLMLMSVAHWFGLYTPKEMADYIEIGCQRLYADIKSLRLHSLQKLMLHFMVKQAAEQFHSVLSKSAATYS